DGGNGLTKGENLRHADLCTVCHLVLNAWNDISDEIITQAFKKCSISNCLSGSKDYFIYDNENDEHSNENSNDYKDGSGVEFDDNEKSNEDEEFYKNESSNQFNNWPECYVVIS
ncbi:34342_t:CDS:1, partial [Gigaspora margarita]